jgi:hypothetical protein
MSLIHRHAIAAGLVALCLSAGASPAFAKGGGDGAGDTKSAGTVVTFISPDAYLYATPPAERRRGANSGHSGV